MYQSRQIIIVNINQSLAVTILISAWKRASQLIETDKNIFLNISETVRRLPKFVLFCALKPTEYSLDSFLQDDLMSVGPLR